MLEPSNIWILSNRKPAERKGKVQLIDASSFWQKMRKSLGSTRKELGPEHIEAITRLFGNFKQAEHNGKPISRIFRNEAFGYRTITVERPLRDEAGNVVLGQRGKAKGQPQADSSLRDTENVPLLEDVQAYFEREVLPQVSDAWIDHEKTKVGYEIPFNRHFAGPNGAGKTTFAREYLPVEVGITTFLNADLIAAGLSPFAPELAAKRAGRLMLEEIDHCSEAAVDFALNTTRARKFFVMKFHQWQVGGYRVKLIFLKLSHEEAAIRRVAERIAQAAHSIPPEVIRRRFVSGLRNFTTLYQPIVDAWQLIDNGGDAPVLLAEGRNR